MANYDAVSPRTYEDRDGNEKTAWTRVGKAFEKDGKITVFLDAYPIPDGGSVKIVLMEPREDNGGNRQRPTGGRDGGRRASGPAFDRDLDDDVPF